MATSRPCEVGIAFDLERPRLGTQAAFGFDVAHRNAWEEELETLVFDREGLSATVSAALDQIAREGVLSAHPPSLELAEDERWLEELPPAARLVLERLRRRCAAWPAAPRIAFAIAQPT